MDVSHFCNKKSLKGLVIKKTFIIVNLFLLVSGVYGQVGINTLNPNLNAALDITADNKGVLLPRVGLKDINSFYPIAREPKNSLLLYNTTVNETLKEGFYYWYKGQWNPLLDEKYVSSFLHTGEGIPEDSFGKEKEMYLSLNDKKIYQKKEGKWKEKTSFQGPPGLPAALGPTGDSGKDGDPGKDGKNGRNGEKGDKGGDVPRGTIILFDANKSIPSGWINCCDNNDNGFSVSDLKSTDPQVILLIKT